MSNTKSARRFATLAVAGLVAALLPAFGATAPASAAGPCESEKQTGSVFGATVCDDTSQPSTTLAGASPTPNGAGYINVDHVTFTFGGAASPGDTDPIAYQCQFFNSATTPSTWQACTSPATYDHLADAGPDNPTPYTFRVRAVDTADNGLDATTCTGLFCSHADTDVADLDETPATTTVRVDTTRPDTYILDAPTDDQGSDYPMSTSRTVRLRLDATEGTDADPLNYGCKLDGAKVDCNQGITTLTGLGGGDHTFTAAATDRAGNTDQSPAVAKFSVPKNLVKADGWATRREGGYFAGDYLESRRVGAQLSVPGKNVRELLLIAPAGPGLGVVEVKIGQSIWRPVNLNAPSYTRFKIYKVRDRYDPLVSGKILIRVKQLDKNQVVRVDAVLAH
jgi:hypothetical protein